MDSNMFRELRESIERKCSDLDGFIKAKAITDTYYRLLDINESIKTLRNNADGEIQIRSVRNLDNKLLSIKDKIDKILSNREAGKRGDGNIAFKCNWNDNNYKAPCSYEAYKHNLSEGRAWCSSPQCKCRQFSEDVSLASHPCYESIALKELYFGAGWDHTGDRQEPRHIHNVKENRIAILTTRPPGAEEIDRIIIGCLFINKVNDDPGEETKIYGDCGKSIIIPFNQIKIRFWDYYKNPGAEDLVLWASGLFRYVTNGTVVKILKAIGEQYTNTGRDIQIILDSIMYFEKLMNPRQSA